MVTDRIIAELEKRNIPWKRPWTGVRTKAYNRITKKPYSIINQILLKHSGEYATFKQWSDLGGHIKKGEKSEIVVFWKIYQKEETNEETGESKSYLIPYGSRIKVQDGVMLEAGDELTEGSVNPHDILKIKGLRATQDYMLQEVQRVYRLQGVEINDKHIEVIVRQMLKKIRIEEKGDTEFLPGTMVDVLEFEEVNEQLVAEGKEPATGEQIMLGITKASLATESFLSAASFQETTKVLTEAAIKGKVDHLVGLKENVIIGKHIPAGTGMKKYRDVKLNTDIKMEDELDLEDDIEFDENGDLTDEVTEEAIVDENADAVEETVTETEESTEE